MIEPKDITFETRKYAKRNEGNFPQRIVAVLDKITDIKYGENPNQHGAVYTTVAIFKGIPELVQKVTCNGRFTSIEDILDLAECDQANAIARISGAQWIRDDGKGKGGESGTNWMDVARGMDCLKWFEKPTVAIMKHNMLSGFATDTKGSSVPEVYRLARDADRQSNMGGTVVFNRPVDMATAHALYELKGKGQFFPDVIAAPEFEQGTLGFIESSADFVRVAKYETLKPLPKFIGDDTHGMYSIKEMPGNLFLVQDIYLSSIRGPEDLTMRPMVREKNGTTHTIETVPTPEQVRDLLTSWYINISGARSNGVVFVRDGVSVAIGAGQVERVGATQQAVIKGMQKAMDREGIDYDSLKGVMNYETLKDNPFKGAVCSSDAFFPFGDCIKLMGAKGVVAIIQPYGSKRDAESIDAANALGIAMPATLERCFGHW
jgi:phosphoribosylaminoimidazolecarboxamide formyltransferase/IMP cyclohydrolase